MEYNTRTTVGSDLLQNLKLIIFLPNMHNWKYIANHTIRIFKIPGPLFLNSGKVMYLYIYFNAKLY